MGKTGGGRGTNGYVTKGTSVERRSHLTVIEGGKAADLRQQAGRVLSVLDEMERTDVHDPRFDRLDDAWLAGQRQARTRAAVHAANMREAMRRAVEEYVSSVRDDDSSDGVDSDLADAVADEFLGSLSDTEAYADDAVDALADVYARRDLDE